MRQSIDEYAKPDNWHKLREPAEGLARSVTDGVIGGLAGPLRDDRVAAAIDAYVTAFTQAAARELGTALGPEIQRQVRAAVAATVDELLAEPVQARLELAVDRITGSAIAALGASAARTLTADLGPALAAMMERQVVPALVRSLTQQLGPALATVMRDQLAVAFGQALEKEISPRLVAMSGDAAEAAAHGFVRGALAELDPKLSKLSARVDQIAARSQRDILVLEIVAVCGIVLIGAALGALLWTRRRRARLGYAALDLVAQIRGMRDEDAMQLLIRMRGNDALAEFLRHRS